MAWKNRDKTLAYAREYNKKYRAKLRSTPEGVEQLQAYMRKKIRTPKIRFSRAKWAAKERQKDWTLGLAEYTVLVSEPCFYCHRSISETGIGLDRSDHRIGYVHGNVVPCCTECNSRKGGLEAAGFLYPRTVELLLELLNGKNEGSNQN